MAYSQSYAKSARRHFRAAEHLDTNNHRDVAGYLFGVAAECALKEIMRNSGMLPLDSSERQNDPFYKHFQEIKRFLLHGRLGRRAAELRRYAEDGQLLQYWDTDMRYAPAGDIQLPWVEKWRAQAKALIEAMDA